MATITLTIDDKKKELLDDRFVGHDKKEGLQKYLENEIESLVNSTVRQEVPQVINPTTIQEAIDKIEHKNVVEEVPEEPEPI